MFFLPLELAPWTPLTTHYRTYSGEYGWSGYVPSLGEPLAITILGTHASLTGTSALSILRVTSSTLLGYTSPSLSYAAPGLASAGAAPFSGVALLFTSSLSGVSLGHRVFLNFTYSQPGDYVIAINHKVLARHGPATLEQVAQEFKNSPRPVSVLFQRNPSPRSFIMDV